MQTISQAIDKAMPQSVQHSGIQSNRSKTLSLLAKPSDSVIQNGIDAFAVIDSPQVSTDTFIKAMAYLQQAYGLEYPKEKFAVLFDLIKDEKWTEERFQRTLKWFLKTKYNQAWTIADWWQYNVKLYPWQHYRIHCAKNNIREIDYQKTLDCYLVDGIRLYRESDGLELPLERAL